MQKIRIWDKTHRKFLIEGTAVLDDKGKVLILRSVDKKTGWLFTYPATQDRYIISRQSDFKDANSRQIFTGDIVHHFRPERILELSSEMVTIPWRDRLGIVQFDKEFGAFVIEWLSGSGEVIDREHLHGRKNLEIIGNTFENPDLLVDFDQYANKTKEEK
jgi:hypothetical protein